MQKLNSKNNKGITLVALVITIIVLLVLAVVSIRLVMNGSIIEKTKYAIQRQNLEQIEEKIKLQEAEMEMAKYATGHVGEITVKEILEKNDEAIETVNIASGASTIPANMPAGEYYLLTPTKYVANNNVERNVSRYAKLTSRGEERGIDELKDIYVINDNLEVYYVIEGNVGFGVGKATVGIKVEKNSTIDGKEYSSKNPIIPTGFKAINTNTSEWDAVGGPEIDKGLVIRDEDGNEFVWVPVSEGINTTEYRYTGMDLDGYYHMEPDVITGYGNQYDAVVSNLQRAGCTENPEDNDTVLTSDDFKAELTKMYKTMAESVNKYGGFYVGRFETSEKGRNPQSKRSSSVSGSGELIETAYYRSSGNNDWYDLYALNKKYRTSSVQGSMMWGIQYDKMMSWMGDTANITISGYNTDKTCGTAPNDVIKNVYDIYGNTKEWTLEIGNSTLRTVRGGHNYKPNYRMTASGDGSPDGGFASSGTIGSRLALYIK